VMTPPKSQITASIILVLPHADELGGGYSALMRGV